MTLIPLKDWATKHNISRRKAEYLANKNQERIVMLPQKFARTVFIKCIDADLKPADLDLRS